MPVAPIPAGYHSITPYLIVRDGARALDFYKNALGAVETVRMSRPDGKIGHAEIRLGNSMVMLADEAPDMGIVGPQTLGGAGVSILLYVEDADARFARAIAAGATVERAMADQFYGDRSGTLKDPFGHVWTIATHTEDVSPEEMKRRMSAMGKQA